jgi:hypothetical protein
MFVAARFLTPPNWKNITDEWISKCIYIQWKIRAIKRNEVLKFAIT